MANPGAEGFFGGLAEGLGSGLLQREQMNAQKKARESEQRMDLWKLIYSNPDIPDATKMQFGKMVFQQPAQEGPIAKIKGAFGKGKKQQPPSASDIFAKLQDAMGQQAPAPSSTAPMPQVGGGAAAQTPPTQATPSAAPAAIPNLPGVPQGAGGMPYDRGISRPPTGVPSMPDLSTVAGRREAEFMRETRFQGDEATRQAVGREKAVLDYRLGEIEKSDLTPQEKKIATVEAITGHTLPTAARPETLDQTAADLFQRYQSGQLTDEQFQKAVASLHSISGAIKPPTAVAAGTKPLPTKTIMAPDPKTGKMVPTIMMWDAQTGAYDIPQGKAPSSTGYPRTFPINDAKGNVTGAYIIKANPSGGFTMGKMDFAQPIPPKPTSSVLTQSQRALMIQPQVQQTVALVRNVADQLGPLKGRWNDFMAGRIGAKAPLLADLQMRLTLFATALMLAHGLRGQGYEEALGRYLNASQSPENLVARIKSADSFLQDYAASTSHGTEAPTVAKGKKGATPPVPTPQTQSNPDPLGVY
jgi:hypothetical protein